jgi:predicted TIM-barrel fold metal-dependent hydrolase
MNIETNPRREFARRATPTPIDPRGADYKVVDTDFHFTPEWESLRRYMKEPFRSEMKRYPLVGADYSPQIATGLDGTGQDVLGRATTAADVLRVMNDIHADTVILSPGFQRPQSMFHKTMVTTLASAFNDYLVNEVFPVSPRIKASVMINHRDPAAGAAEIRRVGDHPQFLAVYTEFGGNYEPIGSAPHDPIFEAAVERDLAVVTHIGTFWQQFTPIAEGTRTWTELVGISSVSICLAFVASMIMQGLFDKFPTLKVVVQEGGFWWLADFMARADDYYLSHPGDIKMTERKLESGERFLRKLPSEYFESNIRFSSQPVCMPKNPKHFKMLMDVCFGEDLLMYSSDWPHATFDPLNWVFNPDISEAGRRKILVDNAMNWYPRLKGLTRSA